MLYFINHDLAGRPSTDVRVKAYSYSYSGWPWRDRDPKDPAATCWGLCWGATCWGATCWIPPRWQRFDGGAGKQFRYSSFQACYSKGPFYAMSGSLFNTFQYTEWSILGICMLIHSMDLLGCIQVQIISRPSSWLLMLLVYPGRNDWGRLQSNDFDVFALPNVSARI